jgi:phosphoserine aminotransferase
MLPVDVLEEAQADLVSYKGSGMSVLEMSHRGKEYMEIQAKAEADLRALLNVPENYKVLFLQGGASTQFAAVALNLTQPGDVVDHVVTGAWSKKAVAEAKKLGLDARVVAKGSGNDAPAPSTWQLSEGSRYVHFCSNETIGGVEYKEDPDVGDRLLIADMSSNILSKPVDVSKYAVIYFGAQKNVGPSGVTVAIVRDDLVGQARPDCPTMLEWSIAAENDSMYNTPPCFSIYVCGLVFARLLAKGGLAAMQKVNESKASLVYNVIDGSAGFYNCPVEKSVRSCMNIPFTIPSSKDLEAEFIKGAGAKGLVQIKGHRSVGGMRASIYNAMPTEGCQALADFMEEFRAAHA